MNNFSPLPSPLPTPTHFCITPWYQGTCYRFFHPYPPLPNRPPGSKFLATNSTDNSNSFLAAGEGHVSNCINSLFPKLFPTRFAGTCTLSGRTARFVPRTLHWVIDQIHLALPHHALRGRHDHFAVRNPLYRDRRTRTKFTQDAFLIPLFLCRLAPCTSCTAWFDFIKKVSGLFKFVVHIYCFFL
jgi:hypothetical protein